MYKLAYAAGEKKRNLKKEARDEVTNEARLARSFFKVPPLRRVWSARLLWKCSISFRLISFGVHFVWIFTVSLIVRLCYGFL